MTTRKPESVHMTSSLTINPTSKLRPDTYHIPISQWIDQGRLGELAELLSTQQKRLNAQEALELQAYPDLFALGELASQVCEKRHGHQVYYNINRHINPTNICVYSCRFCSYAKKPKDKGAYAYSTEEILAKTAEAVREGADEIHMVGGLHPRWNLDHFLNIISAIKQQAPHIHLKGFTAVELWWLAKKARLSLRDTLISLKKAGLDSLPGGGAEIFDSEIRQKITAKMDSDSWLNTHETAHSIGFKSNATMLYGHVEQPYHRIHHMLRLRDLQDKTHGFNAFIPLAFQPHDNTMNITDYTLGECDLRTIAMARLVLDNFPYIKAYWIMLGQDIAQLSPYFGANDLDGTVAEEKIAKAAGGRSGDHLSESKLHAMIHACGKAPTRRDSIYQRFELQSPPRPILKSHQMESKLTQILTAMISSVRIDEITSLHNLWCANLKETLDQQMSDPIQLLNKNWHLILRASQSLTKAIHTQNIRSLTPTTSHTEEKLTESDTDQPATDSSHHMLVLDSASVSSLHQLIHHLQLLRKTPQRPPLGIMCEADEIYDLTQHPSRLNRLIELTDVIWVRDHHADINIKAMTKPLDCCAKHNTKIYLPLRVTAADQADPSAMLRRIWGFDDLSCHHLATSILTLIFDPHHTFMTSQLCQLTSLIRLSSRVLHLSTPITRLPSLSVVKFRNQSTQRSQDKLIGILAATSINDFGLIEAKTFDERLVRKIFSAAGGYIWHA